MDISADPSGIGVPDPSHSSNHWHSMFNVQDSKPFQASQASQASQESLAKPAKPAKPGEGQGKVRGEPSQGKGPLTYESVRYLILADSKGRKRNCAQGPFDKRLTPFSGSKTNGASTPSLAPLALRPPTFQRLPPAKQP